MLMLAYIVNYVYYVLITGVLDMLQRHKSGQPLDPNLMKTPQGIYEGEAHEILGKVAFTRIGVALFPKKDLEIVAAKLGSIGFMPVAQAGSSKVTAGEAGAQGELHRHDEHSVIVHQTSQGVGSANFHWPVADDHGFDPDFVLDLRRDVVHLSATAVPVNPDTIIVFPGNTWHQFNTDSNQTRVSAFRHYTDS